MASRPKKTLTLKKTTVTKKQRKTGYNGLIKPNQFKKALHGTGGIAKLIAERLGVSWTAVYQRIKWMREGDKRCDSAAWRECWELYQQEEEYMGDIAEETVKVVMQQRLDLGTAFRAARFHLERKHTNRGYVDNKQLTLEGGKVPLAIEHQNLLPLDVLNLPLHVRKKLLSAVRKAKATTGEDIK